MIILSIETSCDETSVALVNDKKEVLGNLIYSQIKEHKKFGGVVPEIASRKHIEKIYPLTKVLFDEARVTINDIDLIGVTQGPGLVGSLLVGINFAKGISFSLKKPLLGINHLEGHILSVLIENEVNFPSLTLVVSGGHTSLFYVKNPCEYLLLGKTVDDAVGEAFDKVAKMLNLGYPGGPIVEKLALNGDENAIKFPCAFMRKENFKFSFSGLKTAVLNYISKNEEYSKEDVCASFQKAIKEVLIFKLGEAYKKHPEINSVCFVGGVACNNYLRIQLKDFVESHLNKEFFIPSPIYCTDNAAMIGIASLFRAKKEDNLKIDLSMNAEPRKILC